MHKSKNTNRQRGGPPVEPARLRSIVLTVYSNSEKRRHLEGEIEFFLCSKI
jgi:hypothetical protein